MKNNKVLITLIICITLIVIPLIGYYIYRSTKIKKAELKQECQVTYDKRLSEIEKGYAVDVQPQSNDDGTVVGYFEAWNNNNQSRMRYPNDTPENRKSAQDQYDKCVKDANDII